MLPSAKHPHSADSALFCLQQTWRRLTLLTIVGLLAGFGGLAAARELEFATRWLGLAALTAGYSLAFLKRNLGRNRAAAAAPLHADLGPATLVTLLRGILLAAVCGFLLSARPPGGLAWIPAILFTAAMVLDILDGVLARRSGRQTELGRSFDLAHDRLGVLIGSALAVWYRVLPWPFLSIGLAGYLFEFGRWARRRAGREIRELPLRFSRRPMAGVMMGFLSAVLWPIVGPPATTLAGVLILVPFMAGFVRDWQAVSGRLDRASMRKPEG